MTDVEMAKTRVGALTQAIADERAKRDSLLKASTLDEEIHKISADTEELVARLKRTQEKHSEAIARRDEAVRTSLGAMEAKIQEMLPFGEAVMSYNEDCRLEIGWAIDGKTIPYWALSGGQKMIFDPAVAFSLLVRAQSKLVIMEGAEMDTGNLAATLQQISEQKPDAQIICNSWHGAGLTEIDGWETVILEGSDGGTPEEEDDDAPEDEG